ncbi:MAG: dTMP kinase [Bryobacteraceae bacterium]|nr:dTMP kinase [Bryobacteraceae bacterium]
MTERGLFITFEGVDGCGKSTQMRRLASALRAHGHTVVETIEPGGTAIGAQIRAILLDPANAALGPRAELLLYFAARAQNVDEILEPAIARGEIVLSDRWTDSTLAYQGHGRQLGEDVVRSLDAIACRGRRPDLTLWVDVDVDLALARAGARNSAESNTANRMDSQQRDFYLRVADAYRALAEREPARVRRVDGSGSLDDVFQEVWSTFQTWRTGHV